MHKVLFERAKATGRPTTWHQDLLAVAFGVWLVSGVFVDGWAHFNRTALETFFTPWHGLLYSGAAASFAYLTLVAYRNGGVPPGYRTGLLAAPLFLVAGAGDFVWHQLFGIEVGLDALLSPTHLILLASGLAVLSTAWRVDVTRGGSAGIPGVLSLTITTALGSFFLLYVSAFAEPLANVGLTRVPEGAPGHMESELPAIAGLGGYLLTTVLLVIPMIFLLRRSSVPFGSATALLTTVATLSTLVVDSAQPLVPIAAAITGVVLDLLLRASQHWPAARRVLVVVTVLPLVLWPLQLLGLALTDAVRWPVELWSGVVILSGAGAALLGYLSLGVRNETSSAPPAPSRPRVRDRVRVQDQVVRS